MFGWEYAFVCKGDSVFVFSCENNCVVLFKKDHVVVVVVDDDDVVVVNSACGVNVPKPINEELVNYNLSCCLRSAKRF